MKTLLKILFIVIYTLNISAQTYVIDGNTVYYYDKPIPGADAESFDLLYEDKYFSKDKNNIYYKGKKTDFDSKSFKIHRVKAYYDQVYFSDNNDVYFKEEDNFISLGSQSPKNFKIITEDIAVDGELIYWKFKPIINSDAASFQIINYKLFKDKNHVYRRRHILPIKPSKIKIYKKIKYYRGYLIKNFGDNDIICDDYNCYPLNTADFKYINYNYIKDDNHVIFRHSYIKADALSFEVPMSDMEHYAKDKYHQYYLDDVFPIKVDQKHIKRDSLRAFKIKLKNQLNKAFKVHDIQKKYDKDTKASLTTIYSFPNSNNTIIEKGKFVYMNGIRQKFIDAKSFEIFNNDYAKDKNQVYLIYEYADKVTFNPIKGIDPNTFSIINNNYDSYCKDTNNVYNRLDKVVGADPNSFEVLNKDYAKDKNAIYVLNLRLENVKPVQGVSLKNIDYSYYYSLGNKYLYIDDAKAILVENPILNDFEVLNDYYALNGEELIYKGKTIAVLEQGENILDEYEARLTTTKQRIFQYGVDINVGNRQLQQYLYTNYFTDGHTLYYNGIHKIKGVDIEDIYFTDYYLIFKNNKALFKEKTFDIDSKSFETLSHFYSRDKNYVYYKGVKTNLDSKSFFVLQSGYTADKNAVYYNNKLIPKADSKSFYVFGKYGFDKTYFYHKNKKIRRSKVNLSI